MINFFNLDSDNQPLPTDSSGRQLLSFNEKPGQEEVTLRQTLPTDSSGQLIYPIVHADGTPLDKDSTGRYTSRDGEAIPLDAFGRPLNPKTLRVLSQDDDDRFVYVEEEEPTPGRVPIVGVDAETGRVLPTDSSGSFVSFFLCLEFGDLKKKQKVFFELSWTRMDARIRQTLTGFQSMRRMVKRCQPTRMANLSLVREEEEDSRKKRTFERFQRTRPVD